MRNIIRIIFYVLATAICAFILAYPLLFLLRYDSQKIYFMLGIGTTCLVFFISEHLLDLIDRIFDRFDKY